MKQKLFYIILCFLLLGGCRDKVESKREQDYIETLGRDYSTVLQDYPEAKLKTATCVFSGDLRNTRDTIKIVDYTEVYQVRDGCIVVYPDTLHTIKRRTSGGQMDILPGELELTFLEAVEILREANYILPQTQIFVIQKPEGYIHPLYVFGSGHESWIAVDSRTKKIYKL